VSALKGAAHPTIITMKLSEKVLYYIWQYRLYDHRQLATTCGKTLSIKSPGQLNVHAGPDFEYSRIVIDGIEWAGSVEIHIKSSDWYTHGHHVDAAYNKVILHVVYEDDGAIRSQDGFAPKTLAIKPFMNAALLEQYDALVNSRLWIPCASQLHEVSEINARQWLERMLVERLEEKWMGVKTLMEANLQDWEEITYVLLAKNFGFKVNGFAFEQLAKHLPYKLLLKNRHHPIAIEALVFGQAGFLQSADDHHDTYYQTLQKEYTYLTKQYTLRPLEYSLWKFLRLRPANFPTMRLAQFAAWCIKEEHLFSKILALTDIKDYRSLFIQLPVHAYWESHFRFGHPAKKKHHIQLGRASIDNILLNTVVTILFSYGKYMGKEVYIYRAIGLLEQLKAEQNQLVSRYRTLGLSAHTAAESQGLLQLKAAYCNKQRCLACGIGLQVFKLNKTL